MDSSLNHSRKVFRAGFELTKRSTHASRLFTKGVGLENMHSTTHSGTLSIDGLDPTTTVCGRFDEGPHLSYVPSTVWSGGIISAEGPTRAFTSFVVFSKALWSWSTYLFLLHWHFSAEGTSGAFTSSTVFSLVPGRVWQISSFCALTIYFWNPSLKSLRQEVLQK